MNEKLDINELVELKQLPVIFYQLEQFGEQIDKELALVKDMQCTEENKQEIKKIRSNINKLKDEFENKRKEIKNKVLENYNQFNEKYEKEVKTKLETASEDLKNKISEIEKEQLRVKIDEIREFAENHIEANDLKDYLNSDTAILQSGISINLSSSVKSLKDALKCFIERVSDEIKLIEQEEHAEMIMLEYLSDFNYIRAKTVVLERARRTKELQEQLELKKEKTQEQEQQEQLVEEIIAPVEEVEEELMSINFKATGTKEQLIGLREYMKKVGIKYE